MSTPVIEDTAFTPTPRLIPGIRLPSGVVTPGKRKSPSLRLRNAIVASSFELEGMRVLDVGCSDGRQSLYLAARAAEVWGVDHRSSQIEIARNTADALGIKNVRFKAGDVRDPDLFRDIGKFDLAIAWGFLHRITDIFALFYALEPITNAISLEWRSPVLPMMEQMSLAYHPAGAAILDPMNTGRKADLSSAEPMRDSDKVQGRSAFWEPTPGAVKAMLQRLDYVHDTLIGYDEELLPQDAIMGLWRDHEAEQRGGRRAATDLPEARVHMLFEKRAGSIPLVSREVAKGRIPAWDDALLRHLHAFENRPQAKNRNGLLSRARALAKGLRRRLGGGGTSRAKVEKVAGGPRRRAGYNRARLHAEMLRQAPLIVADASAGTKAPVAGSRQTAHPAGSDIQIAEIDFAKLEVVPYDSRQLAGHLQESGQLPRVLFRDGEYFYKIWRRDYDRHRRIVVGRETVTAIALDQDCRERLWGRQVGLFDQGLCPAFAGCIYNGTRLVGYRTLAGDPLRELSMQGKSSLQFVERLLANTLRSGFVYADMKLRNLVRLPSGEISLIDFDGRLGTLYKFEPSIEERHGVLRPHILGPYRDLMLRFSDPGNADADIARMREKAGSIPPMLAGALNRKSASGQSA